MATIYEVLKKDHDSHREVLNKLDATSGDSPEREKLYATMKRELEAHTAAEEETFYATLMAKPDGQEKARHSVSEHKEAADLLGELDETEFSSPGWLARFRKLKEELEHHMDEEENEVFARARKLIAQPKAEELGSEFLRRKRAEM
jgi:iron-sulfur cluster repair protein YtfE (RIC family)